MFDNLTLVLFIWIVGAICFLGLIVLFIVTLVANLRSKQHKWFAISKWYLGAVCFIGLYLVLPYYIYPYALAQQDMEKSISYSKIAAAIAIIPSVKSDLYYEISTMYKIQSESDKAIEAYEKGLKFGGKPNKIYQTLICPLYLWKGNVDNVLNTCSQEMTAIYYLKENNYDKSLETINSYISELDSSDLRRMCFARGTRASINKKIGNTQAFKNDADFVNNECAYYRNAVKYVEAEDIVEFRAGKNPYRAN